MKHPQISMVLLTLFLFAQITEGRRHMFSSDWGDWFEGAFEETEDWFHGAWDDTEDWVQGAWDDTIHWIEEQWQELRCSVYSGSKASTLYEMLKDEKGQDMEEILKSHSS